LASMPMAGRIPRHLPAARSFRGSRCMAGLLLSALGKSDLLRLQPVQHGGVWGDRCFPQMTGPLVEPRLELGRRVAVLVAAFLLHMAQHRIERLLVMLVDGALALAVDLHQLPGLFLDDGLTLGSEATGG